ncbi:MAG TPA: bifunctional 5,10-methylenetetrahydrofolate dehydrogenase/5,10-methenyltetrahydrofolate cyclohydrolase [Patescibacteria group bacterium]|nr:bifunctional 5,10-methylenetetrahydrofolate dehydrogenase/5,10-methenyltetrahydrofolate cyclohydrolase [Patescibacteria group bacterium]
MEILDGKKIAAEILGGVKNRLAKLDFQPAFCDVLVGDDPASAQYVKMKAKTAEQTGFKFLTAEFPASISAAGLLDELAKLNRRPQLCGLIVQLPLPQGFQTQAVLDAIDPRLDVDCLGRVNTDAFYAGTGRLAYPTALAVMAILDSVPADILGGNFLVIGQGRLVGRPVTALLKRQGRRVATATSETKDLSDLLKAADVVIAAAGRPRLISGEMLKPGCTVIDAGTAEYEGGMTGDVDFSSVSQTAAFLSPVPGGVGPVTVAKLLENVLFVAEQKH